MSTAEPTYIGEVASVVGATVSIQLRADMPSTLVMVEGQTHRVGQVGAFARIPLGYTSLYGVCTQVGAAAAPVSGATNEGPGHRWMTIVLFGESIGGDFERGVSQYPTVGDEVHLTTSSDLQTIYGSEESEGLIDVGHIAASSGLPGRLAIGPLISRHAAIVGSTGTGKTNLVSVLLEAIATQGFPSGRVLLIDPHGEYSSSVGEHAEVFKVDPDIEKGEKALFVPFWALPFDDLQSIVLRGMQPGSEAIVRDMIHERKVDASRYLKFPPPPEAITADSPTPFNIRNLWFDLQKAEHQTYEKSGGVDPSASISAGDAEKLIPTKFPAIGAGGTPPHKNPRPMNILKQLEFMRSRLGDSRFAFLLQPGDEHTPDSDGKIHNDLDELIASWIGHSKPITVLDVSGLPSEILSTVVGTMLRIIYDVLFWAGDLDISGKSQPLMIVLEEAHIFLPEGVQGPAHAPVQRIAKEGRKYGVGLLVVTQRPSEIDSGILSQCGTFIALRLSNTADRAKVQSAMPDDLGSLAALLPALRTGEGLVMGEAMPIPTRIRFHRAKKKPTGDDPPMPESWLQDPRPDARQYTEAVSAWRRRVRSSSKKEN